MVEQANPGIQTTSGHVVEHGRISCFCPFHLPATQGKINSACDIPSGECRSDSFLLGQVKIPTSQIVAPIRCGGLNGEAFLRPHSTNRTSDNRPTMGFLASRANLIEIADPGPAARG